MVDHPGYQPDQRTDFESLIRGNASSNQTEATRRLQDQSQTGLKPGDIVQVGTDATNTSQIKDKTLELNYTDPHFDTKMAFAGQNAAKYFDKIKIDNLPANSVMHTWMDGNGYYLWTTDNPKARHYLPDNAFSLQANNAKIDLETERIKDNQAFAQANFGGFENFNRNFVPARDGSVNSTNYYLKISGATDAALAVQEHALRESVRSSANPYFKIYLSDIEAGQALKHIRDNRLAPNNEYTRAKIDESLSLSNAAYTQTRDELGKYNQYPSLEAFLPLAPQRPFWDRSQYPDDWMGFWGGGYGQAYGRQQCLTALRGDLISNFVPQQPHRIPNPRPANPSG